MEARKIIQFGNSSYIISIPKPWIKENKLKKGDLVFLKRNSNGELVLLPKETKEEKIERKIVINADGKDFWTLRREINFNYVEGYDFMIIQSKNIKKNEEKIKMIVEGLVGNQIIEKNTTEIKVKNILNVDGMPLIDLVRRVDNIIRSMFFDVQEGLKNEKFSKKQAEAINEADKDINKLYFLTWKIVRKGLGDRKIAKLLNKSNVGLSYLQWLILNLESLGDEIKRIARLLSQIKLSKKHSKELKELVFILDGDYKNIMTAYYKSDKQLAYKIAGKTHELKKKCEKFAEKSRNEIIGGVGEKLKEAATTIHFISKIAAY